jgi:hypothetical protein
MSLRVSFLSVDNFTNVTKVTVEVKETIGTIERLKDTLSLTLSGRYPSIDDNLMEKIYEELDKNKYSYLPTKS